MKEFIKDLLTAFFCDKKDILKEISEEDVYSEFAMTCATIDF